MVLGARELFIIVGGAMSGLTMDWVNLAALLPALSDYHNLLRGLTGVRIVDRVMVGNVYNRPKSKPNFKRLLLHHH